MYWEHNHVDQSRLYSVFRIFLNLSAYNQMPMKAKKIIAKALAAIALKSAKAAYGAAGAKIIIGSMLANKIASRILISAFKSISTLYRAYVSKNDTRLKK